MRISAKADYAVRAMIELASADEALSAETMCARQAMPVAFLQKILADLRRAGLILTQRGRGGGHLLGRPADQITVADVVRAVEGQLCDVHGSAPGDLDYRDSAEPLQDVWVALRENVREVLEGVTLADLGRGSLPTQIASLVARQDARVRR